MLFLFSPSVFLATENKCSQKSDVGSKKRELAYLSDGADENRAFFKACIANELFCSVTLSTISTVSCILRFKLETAIDSLSVSCVERPV